MNKLISLLAAIILAGFVASAPAHAQVSHEYAPLQEKEFSYNDWKYKSLKDNSPVDLRQFAQDKKLVLVVYFAPWCPNWKNEAPFVAKLSEKYRKDGLGIIGVSEYASRDDAQKFFGTTGPNFVVVSESESRDDREKTGHFGYRQKTGDMRKWGSPYNILFLPTTENPSGEVLLTKAWIANGELVETDAEKFIREKLGLPAEK